MEAAVYALSLCSGCRHHRLAIAVLMHGTGVWIEDECSADMLGVGGRLSCSAFESRWRNASLPEAAMSSPRVPGVGERVSILRPTSQTD